MDQDKINPKGGNEPQKEWGASSWHCENLNNNNNNNNNFNSNILVRFFRNYLRISCYELVITIVISYKSS